MFYSLCRVHDQLLMEQDKTTIHTIAFTKYTISFRRNRIAIFAVPWNKTAIYYYSLYIVYN